MRSVIISCLIVLFFRFIAFPQTLPWQRINPIPFENYIYDSQLLDNGELIVVGSGCSVFSTDDMGDSWDLLYQPPWNDWQFNLNALHFINNDVGYVVGAYFTILKTTDGGYTWTDLSLPANNSSDKYNDVYFLSADTGFVIEKNDRLLKTTDGGQSWNMILDSDSLSFDKIEFWDANSGYISLQGASAYFRSLDAGLTWQLMPLNIPYPDFQVAELYFTSITDGHIAGGDDDGDKLLKTINGGDSCYLVHDEWGNFYNRYLFLNRDTGFLLAQVYWYSNSLHMTMNAGEDWELIDDGLGGWSLYTIQMNDQGAGLCMGSNGQVFLSNDHGLNWESHSSYPFLFKFHITHSIIINDSSIVASAIGGGGGVTDYKVVRSDDRGASWHYTSGFAFNIRDITYINDTVGFYCAETEDYWGEPNLIYKTVDGGISWNPTPLEPRFIVPHKIEFINDSIGFIGGSFDHEYGLTMYRTMNSGETWELIEDDLFMMGEYGGFDFFNDSSAYVVGEIYPFDSNAHVLRTTDLGNSWVIDTLPFIYDFSDVHFFNADTGLLIGENKVCRTIDGGQNWFLVDMGYPFYTGYYSCISSFIGGVGYLHIRKQESYNVGTIIKTEDYGETWFDIESPTNTQCLSLSFFSDDEGVWTGEDGTIFKTLTGGLLGIPEQEHGQSQQLHIYPNPSSGHVNIRVCEEFDGGNVFVYDLRGQLIQSKTGLTAGTQEMDMHFPPGIYIIKLVKGTQSISGKLLMVRP